MIKSVEWLNENKTLANLVILDASLHSKKERTEQIPGTRYFDINGKFSDQSSEFPNTMPSAQQFEGEARALGINANSKIIVYDNAGIYSAPRAWFMFKAMGHEDVHVLDGGLPEWKKQEFSTEDLTHSVYPQGNFTAKFDESRIRSIEDIKENIDSKKESLIDARSAGRFEGTAPEPRPELQSGCIVGSENVPFTEVLKDGKYKSKARLQDIFDGDKPMIFTCGSGLTACIILLAAEIADAGSTSVYDGSWTEWAVSHKLFTS